MEDTMREYENAIEISHLSKKYDGFALQDISLTVPKGCIMGFIGQNGAGKTTTIRSILNMMPLDSGIIHVLGYDHEKEECKAKEHIGFVFDEMGFHKVLNATDLNEYSCAVTPPVRQTGNRLSRPAETAGASLLAQSFV